MRLNHAPKGPNMPSLSLFETNKANMLHQNIYQIISIDNLFDELSRAVFLGGQDHKHPLPGVGFNTFLVQASTYSTRGLHALKLIT